MGVGVIGMWMEVGGRSDGGGMSGNGGVGGGMNGGVIIKGRWEVH